jgi:uncharacterized protein YjcR
MHGARAGAPHGNKNAWKHGQRSAKAVAERREVQELCRIAWKSVASIGE